MAGTTSAARRPWRRRPALYLLTPKPGLWRNLSRSRAGDGGGRSGSGRPGEPGPRGCSLLERLLRTCPGRFLVVVLLTFWLVSGALLAQRSGVAAPRLFVALGAFHVHRPNLDGHSWVWSSNEYSHYSDTSIAIFLQSLSVVKRLSTEFAVGYNEVTSMLPGSKRCTIHSIYGDFGRDDFHILS